jgi:hypothetical protein
MSTVNAAIARVISCSPTLQAGIAGANSKKPAWMQLGSIDLNQHIEWTSLDDSHDSERLMQGTVESQLDTRFFELDVRPGWRVVVLEHNDINFLDVLITWNHPHADGMSGRIFHELLLESLNASVSEESSQELAELAELTLHLPGTSSKFPPATEQLVDLPISPMFLLKEAWNDNKPTSLFKSPTQAHWAPIRTSPYKTQFRLFTIEASILSKVLTTCRHHKTTLTALLNGLALLSLVSRLDESTASAFASSTAIDQRRFLPSDHPNYSWLEPKKTIANYVSIMTHTFESALVADVRSELASKATQESLSDGLLNVLWSICARVRGEIEERLRIGLKNDSVGLMKFIPDWKAQFKGDVKKPRKLSWFVTNLGVMNGKPESQGEGVNTSEEEWSIDRAQFTLSTETPVAALLIAAISVKDGKLVITCTWQDTVVEASLGEQIVADLERWLNQIGAQS